RRTGVSAEFDSLARQLGLDDRHLCWRDELASSAGWQGEMTGGVPSHAEAARACLELGLDPEAVELAVEACAAVAESPSLQRLHRHCLWRLRGSELPLYLVDWPMLPEALGAA